MEKKPAAKSARKTPAGKSAKPRAKAVAAGPAPASKRAQQSLRTRKRILDVAEKLLAEHGFHGTTMRQVAELAGVDTALLHYYFDSRQGLFDAVFLRRAEVVNNDRMEALDAYDKAAGKNVTVEGAIEAFLRPVLERCANSDEGWKHYFSLVSQVNSTPVWGGEIMARYFDPVIQRLIGLVHRALPDADLKDLYWSYHLLSGSLTLTLGQTGRIDRLSQGSCKSSDLASIQPRMIAFAAAGFRAVCTGRIAKPAKGKH